MDVHVPYRRVRQSTRPSQYWFDAECRAAKRTTESLERIYRRRPSVETRCLPGRTSSPHSSVYFTRRRPTTGRQRLQTARVMHDSCGTRSTELSSRQLHLSLHTVQMTWPLISLVRSLRFVPIQRQPVRRVSWIAYLCLTHFWCCPTLFVTYTESTTTVFDAHVVQYHLFADNAQSYDHCSVSAASSLVTRLSSCVTDLANSYALLRLQLNPSKTEFIWFGTRHNLAKLPTE